MHPAHRAQLAAAIARFQADIRRLARDARPQERDRLLTALDPRRARSAASGTTGTSDRAAAATRRKPAARARPAATGTRARQADTRRARKPQAAAKPRVEPTVAEPASSTAATTKRVAAETRIEPVMMGRANTEATTAAVGSAAQAAGPQEDQARSGRRERAGVRRDGRREAPAQRRRQQEESALQERPEPGMRDAAAGAERVDSTTGAATTTHDTAAEVRVASPGAQGSSSPPADVSSTSATATTEPRGPAATEATQVGPASGQRGSKRRRWTRDAIIDELARWMMTGTALDASFVKRNGPPGLVPAAIRVFGRFDAALNVAGLHVAKLYPAGPPAPDGLAAKLPRRPGGGAASRRGRPERAASPQRQTGQSMSPASDSRHAAVGTAEDPRGEPAR
jgi:hypothetical protein